MSNEITRAFGQGKKLETAIPLYEPYFLEDVEEKGNRSKRASLLKREQTGNAYADSRVYDMRFISKVVIQIANTHATNGLYYKILGCVDPETVDFDEIQAETLLAGASKVKHSLTDSWSFIKVQVKSAVADTPAIASVSCGGKNK